MKKRGVLKGINVAEAMHRQVIQLPDEIPIRQCIHHIIKFKTNAVMVTDLDGTPLGVVSKTDIPVSTLISDIMVGLPFFCHPDDPLKATIDQMQTLGIHQLYVLGKKDKEVVGMLSYSDIVGLLYRYCRHCLKSGRCTGMFSQKKIPRLTTADVMTHDVILCDSAQTINRVIEIRVTSKSPLTGRNLYID